MAVQVCHDSFVTDGFRKFEEDMSGWMLFLGLLLIGVLFIGFSLLSAGGFGPEKRLEIGTEGGNSRRRLAELQNED